MTAYTKSFDEYCDENGITDDEMPSAYAAWLHKTTGWDGKVSRVETDDTICPTCGQDYAPFRWCPNDHRGMVDKGYTNEPVRLSVPRTLTADERERIAKVLRENGFDSEGGPHSWRCFDKVRYPEPCGCMDGVLDEIAEALIHDSGKPPLDRPCSTCGEPVGYLTARTGWAGGWLHREATTDGHPAAVDDSGKEEN